MIQPKTPGTEESADKPALSGAGCAGRIVEYSETDDGRYLVTLLGITRFRLASEQEADTAFRQVRADYAPYAGDFFPGELPGFARERLTKALRPYLAERDMKTDWTAIDEAPVEMLVNALSMLCPFDPAEKQALLEAPSLEERASALVALLEMANASSAPPAGTPMN
jgi:Lon protease-like protein